MPAILSAPRYKTLKQSEFAPTPLTTKPRSPRRKKNLLSSCQRSQARGEIRPLNWLAHVLLSEPDTESRMGQIMADWIKRDARLAMPPGIQRGFAAHTRIDHFTDAHPLVAQSQARIESPFKRYAPVLIDVFYDHFLSLHWSRFCAQPLRAFVDDVYAQIAAYPGPLPERAREAFVYMRRDDWLGSYGTRDGIALLLQRLSRRLARANHLADATPQLDVHFSALEADFLAFFPQLQAHARANT
jgi:acyl carrier protein phosphodiesterase